MSDSVHFESHLSDKRVPAVERAFDLLELLAAARAGLSLSVISRRLKIPKSSAYYLVTALVKRNCVRRSPDGHVYSLGTGAVTMPKNSDAESDLKMLCLPHLQSLSTRLGMMAQVGIREGAEARIIYRTQLPGPGLDSWVGRHFDLHCTALGKVLICYLTETELGNLFKIRGLPKHNENTISSLDVLKQHLAEIRRQGFATDNEEHELGVRCVASPILNGCCGVVAAIGVFAPTGRLSYTEMSLVGAELTKVAREICRRLNGSPPHESPVI